MKKRRRTHVIGRSLPRVDGPSKVTGSCVYSADISRPDALWAAFVRSPFPHARILRIDAARARRLLGVKAVITAWDIPPRLVGFSLKDKPVLALDRARYIGEKVAAVAAVDQDIAEEALALVDVEYEELPAVFDPLDAMWPEAPLLHPDYAGYEGPNKAPDLKNVRSAERVAKGDIQQGFAESYLILENTFRTHMVHQAFIEPRAGMVELDSQGRVAVWHCHQAPFLVRRWLADYTDIPEERIIIHPVATGGSFGGKEGFDEIMAVYALAAATKMPVRFVESYAEELTDGEPRHAAAVVLRTGVKKDGRLWAWDGRIFYNGGAYGARTPRNGMSGTFMLAGSYRIPHVRMEGCIVYTNQVPCGFFRAPGEVQTLFAVESHMDQLAEALGLDPLEFRLRNALREGDTRSTGRPTRDPRGCDVLRRAARLARWNGTRRATDGKRVKLGRGVALGDHHIGLGESSAELYLESEGTLRLVTAVRDVGVGAYTMYRQIVAEILGVPPDVVQIEVRGTEGPYDEGIRAQRGTHIEGQAVARAATSLAEALRHRAAELWGVPSEQVTWRDGRARANRTKPKRSLTLSDLARDPGPLALRGLGHFKAGIPDVHSFYAVVADVAVDCETGVVKVLRLRLAIDATKVINPVIFKGQLDGALIQGLGYTLTEDLKVEEGRVLTLNLGDYKIPTIADIPALEMSVVQSREGPGPFKVKSVAECGISVVAPAIANAIYAATAVRLKELPITPEKILRGLRERKNPSGS